MEVRELGGPRCTWVSTRPCRYLPPTCLTSLVARAEGTGIGAGRSWSGGGLLRSCTNKAWIRPTTRHRLLLSHRSVTRPASHLRHPDNEIRDEFVIYMYITIYLVYICRQTIVHGGSRASAGGPAQSRQACPIQHPQASQHQGELACLATNESATRRVGA